MTKKGKQILYQKSMFLEEKAHEYRSGMILLTAPNIIVEKPNSPEYAIPGFHNLKF